MQAVSRDSWNCFGCYNFVRKRDACMQKDEAGRFDQLVFLGVAWLQIKMALAVWWDAGGLWTSGGYKLRQTGVDL